jgi:hypothetical protein
LSRAKTLLAAWKETSIIESIFNEAGLSETEFIKLLEAIVRGESIDYQRLAELAVEVASHLSLARGPGSSLLHLAADSQGSLALAEAPLINAEILFRQSGPALSSLRNDTADGIF